MAVTEQTYGSVKKIVWSWTADASGDASEATSGSYDGEILGLATIPDGTNAPTDNYDIVINDADDHDVLLGSGANRDTAVTEYVDRASLAAVAGSVLTLVVSNAGNGGEGVTVLWVR